MDTTGDTIAGVLDETGDTVAGVVEETGDAVADVVEETGDTVADVVEETGDTVADVVEETQDTPADVVDILDGDTDLAGLDESSPDSGENTSTGTASEGTSDDSLIDTVVESGEEITGVDGSGEGGGLTGTLGFVLAPAVEWSTLAVGDESLEEDVHIGESAMSDPPVAYQPDDTLAVSWGYWNGDTTIISGANGSGALTPWNELIYWASVLPADMEALRELSARWSFEVPAGTEYFIGGGDAGVLSALEMGFDVDLGSGVISQGSFRAEVARGSQVWKLDFTGRVNGQNAEMGNFSNTALGSSAGLQPALIDGSIRGIFTGDSGTTAAFSSGFSLQGGNGASLDGMGLLKGSPR